MHLRNDQLAAHLEKPLAPVYFLTGNEPLQMGEAADLIRGKAKLQGYTEREVLEHSASFDWGVLSRAAESMSLFGEQRILDLRLSNPKIGAEGSKALIQYAGNPPSDTLLLITAPKLERSQLNTKWVKLLDQAGVMVQIWPVEGNRLPPWIEQRLRKAGLVPEAGVVEMLVERVEGNLLAATQEIEKLLLLYGPGVVSAERLAEAVADSARFDVFSLVDAVLAGDVARGLRILEGLKSEGIATPVVLWSLSREIRALAEMAFEIERGGSAERVMSAYRVWEKRKPLVRQGLKQPAGHWRDLLAECARTDRLIKGLGRGDPWLQLQDIAVGIAGVSLTG